LNLESYSEAKAASVGQQTQLMSLFFTSVGLIHSSPTNTHTHTHTHLGIVDACVRQLLHGQLVRLPEEQQLLVQEAHLLLGALAVAQLKDRREEKNKNNEGGGRGSNYATNHGGPGISGNASATRAAVISQRRSLAETRPNVQQAAAERIGALHLSAADLKTLIPSIHSARASSIRNFRRLPDSTDLVPEGKKTNTQTPLWISDRT